MGAVKFALTRLASPAPEGPGAVLDVPKPLIAVNGNPVRQVRIGYRLHPFTSFWGPRVNGRSQPPEKVKYWRTSKSDDARKMSGVKNGTVLLPWRKPEASSMLCAQV